MSYISKTTPEAFSFDLTALVMSKIDEFEYQKERNKDLVLYIGLSLPLIVALVLAYPYLKTIFSQFQSYSGISNAFMMVCGLGVLAFLINDLFRQYKQKEMLLMQ